MLRSRVEAKQAQKRRRSRILFAGAMAIAAVAFLRIPWGASYQEGRSVSFRPGDLGDLGAPVVTLPGETVPPGLLPAPYVSQGAWFDDADAQALASELATAVGDSGICVGWEVREDGAANVGSNLGVNRNATSCDRWVAVTVELDYVPEASEASDSAGIEVVGSDDELQRILDDAPGLTEGASVSALLGDDGDLAVANVVSAVPLALASAGLVEPISIVAVADGADATGAMDLGDAEGEDGSDALHQNIGQLKTGGAVLAVAAFGAFALFATRSRKTPPASTADAGAGAERPPGVGGPRAAMRAALGDAARPPAPLPMPAPMPSAPPKQEF